MRGGGYFERAANKVANNIARDMQQQYLTNEEKSERKAKKQFEETDSKYVLIAASIGILLLGLGVVFLGILGWAFIPIFAVPLMAAIYSLIAGRRNIEVAREEQMKTHMMAKGDKRYWGRGEKDDK